MKRLLLFVLIIMGFCGRFASDAKRCPVAQVVVEPVEPLLVRPVQDDMQCRLWVDSVLDRLSLKERVGQLFIYTIAPHQDKSNRELLRKVIEDYKVGGLLFSGGLMQNQVVLTNEAQRMADIPLLITFDGEWGLSMRLRDTPAFPKNMVLGCIQNDSLLYEYGCEMARQCKELGVQVNFAPVADVNINPKNPVINTRSFGEDPVNVANKVIAYARGLEDGGVLSVAKHFPGHGDTDVDSHKALPVLTFTRERLDSVELYPFKKVIEEGLGGIMVDLDNDPTKLIEIVEIGKQLLMTRGTLTTFSIANDVAKYFAIIPALFMVAIPQLAPLNIMGLHSPETAILSAIIFNAVIIPILIPLALRGVQYKPIGASALLRRNLLIYGLGGVIAPFIGIKLIDMFVSLFF